MPVFPPMRRPVARLFVPTVGFIVGAAPVPHCFLRLPRRSYSKSMPPYPLLAYSSNRLNFS
jgi:hypothetical protein